jgi:dihydroorotate dehydrogenase electron transfer subunit
VDGPAHGLSHGAICRGRGGRVRRGRLGPPGRTLPDLEHRKGRGHESAAKIEDEEKRLKALASVAAKHAVPAEFSLESVMGCGVGACWGCVHRIKGSAGEGWVKICEEGPVFPGERILWP